MAKVRSGGFVKIADKIFISPKDLVEFVLTECSGIRYKFTVQNQGEEKWRYITRLLKGHTSLKIKTENPSLERIYFLY